MNFSLPVINEGAGHNDQALVDKAFDLESCQEYTDLNSLAEAHVVRKNASVFGLEVLIQEVDAIYLMVEQLRENLWVDVKDFLLGYQL